MLSAFAKGEKSVAHYEIERKYLIRIPPRTVRFAAAHMEQTYLRNETASERVRKVTRDGRTIFYHTIKHRVSGLKCLEEETEISEKEAAALLSRPRDGITIVKDRYYYPYGGHTFEIDIYPFWSRQCVMEVEMAREDETVELPPDITVIREVTGERRYKNAAMAREIPEEEL